MKGKKKREQGEVSYWEAMADSMTALLLFILLIMLLLVLYLVRIPDESLKDDHPNESIVAQESTEQDEENDEHDKDDLSNEKDQDSSESDNSGSGKEASPKESEKESDRAAVLVQLKDQETGKLVKVPGVSFELYHKNALRVLRTYYPEKIDYKAYSTTDNGNFYLPEKIPLTSYDLRSLSGLDGYYIPDKMHFKITKPHDWNSPYIVNVILSPEKNVIKIQLKDRETNHAITGASFSVVAAEDIITKDGTLRYDQGELVETISLDENGYGESQELYLGQYTLQQNKIPEFYAKVTTPVNVNLAKQDDEDDQVQKIVEELTTADIVITDELNEGKGIPGARVSVKAGKEAAKSYTTDQNGRIHLYNMPKNTHYSIKQISSLKNYSLDDQEYSFTVNADGLIQDAASTEVMITNRIIKINIDIKDKLYHKKLSDRKMMLKTKDGQIVDKWISNGLTHAIEGLKPGRYQLIIDEKEDSAYDFTVQDTKEIQEITYFYWTKVDSFTVMGAAYAGLLILILLLLFINSKRKRHF